MTKSVLPDIGIGLNRENGMKEQYNVLTKFFSCGMIKQKKGGHIYERQ